jgi:hypothetical protein
MVEAANPQGTTQQALHAHSTTGDPSMEQTPGENESPPRSEADTIPASNAVGWRPT